jgi:hypothetical protein
MRVDDIAASWMERLLRQYAGQSANFLVGTLDPFRNPIGQRFRESLHTVVEELLGDMNPERIADALAGIMEIRAVESCTPREALSFLFELREIAGDQVTPSRIDDVALAAFDEYVKCRERICTAKVNEATRRLFVLKKIIAGGEA